VSVSFPRTRASFVGTVSGRSRRLNGGYLPRDDNTIFNDSDLTDWLVTTDVVNNQSAVWRVDSGGRESILCLGDFAAEG